MSQYLLTTRGFLDWGLKERGANEGGKQECGPEGPTISKRGSIEAIATDAAWERGHAGLSNGPIQVVTRCCEDGITLTMIVQVVDHDPVICHPNCQVAIDDS